MKHTLERTPSAARSEETGFCHARFCIGGVSVNLAGDHPDAVALTPALRPFQSNVDLCDIHLRVRWVDELSAPPERKLFDSGALWRLYERASGFEFDFVAPVFGNLPYKRLLTDRDFSRGTLEMRRAAVSLVPEAAPLDYPLDELLIMHRLTQEKAIELHSCGIVRGDGVGNLFVGHSGAGKSTTTRLWREREDVDVLSDDRIIVRRDAAETLLEAPRDAGFGDGKHGVLRLRDCPASPASRSAQDDKNRGGRIKDDTNTDGTRKKMRMYGTPWHGEAMFALPGSAPLKRIFVLEHGRGNVLTRLSSNQAVAELFARSFVPFHRHEYVESALKFLEEIAAAVPCYRFTFEPNQGAVETILNLHD